MKDERLETSKKKTYESTVHEKYHIKAYKSIVYEKYKNVDKSTGQYKIGYVKIYEIWKYRK